MKNTVPLLDLNHQYDHIEGDVMAAIQRVFDSKQFINGPDVSLLEKDIAQYCGCLDAVGVSSGTDALLISLMALDIGHGDEVITTPFTFFATGGSIARVGATPVFVDIDPETFNIDPALIESKITSKTKAIMPVHLFGQMADMDSIMQIAKKHGLSVIEDSAQSIGSGFINQNGVDQKAGSVGDLGCFSFFPSKNLGAMGDAGIVTTNDAELAEKLRVLRNHGSKPKYYHHLVGGNFRIDTIQAAVLRVKLPYLDAQHEKRRENANYYFEHLRDVVIPPIKDGFYSIFNQFTIRTPQRDSLQNFLKDRGIGSMVYYPVSLHLQDCFQHLGYQVSDFPHCEKACNEVLSIPIYDGLREDQLEQVVHSIHEAVRSFS